MAQRTSRRPARGTTAATAPEAGGKDHVPTAAERARANKSDVWTKHPPDEECGITGSHPKTACGKLAAARDEEAGA